MCQQARCQQSSSNIHQTPDLVCCSDLLACWSLMPMPPKAVHSPSQCLLINMGHFGLAQVTGLNCGWNLRGGDRYSEHLTLAGLLVISTLKFCELPIYFTQKSIWLTWVMGNNRLCLLPTIVKVKLALTQKNPGQSLSHLKQKLPWKVDIEMDTSSRKSVTHGHFYKAIKWPGRLS